MNNYQYSGHESLCAAALVGNSYEMFGQNDLENSNANKASSMDEKTDDDMILKPTESENAESERHDLEDTADMISEPDGCTEKAENTEVQSETIPAENVFTSDLEPDILEEQNVSAPNASVQSVQPKIKRTKSKLELYLAETWFLHLGAFIFLILLTLIVSKLMHLNFIMILAVAIGAYVLSIAAEYHRIAKAEKKSEVKKAESDNVEAESSVKESEALWDDIYIETLSTGDFLGNINMNMLNESSISPLSDETENQNSNTQTETH